jgi:hypothetical protein
MTNVLDERYRRLLRILPSDTEQTGTVVVTGTVEAGVVAVLGLAAALRARRALRRLPSVGAAEADALAQNG